MRQVFLCFSISFLLAFVACGGGNNYDYTPPPPKIIPAACQAVVTAPNTNPNRPVIQLNGPRVVNQPLGQAYVDAGATASDPKDGDITSHVSITGADQVNINSAADYLVRYNVKDSLGLMADEVVRIVRVNAGTYARQTARDYGTTSAIMGYFEHLPPNYGDNPSQGFPVIIHNHGVGENVDFVQNDNDVYASSPDKLNYLLRRGLSGVIDHGTWDDSRPFIVLSPQRCLAFADTQIESFVEYALRTYNVDPTRVYMTGFSGGSYNTWDHLRLHPNTIAAAITISGGAGPLITPPSTACPIASTPTWSFHAKDDQTVPVSDTINTVAVVKGCDPSVPHRMTIFASGGHLIDVDTLEETRMGTGDPQYDLFDQDIYQWLLQYSLASAEKR